MYSIEKSLSALNQQMAQLEKRYGRTPGAVKLLAVSKRQPCEKIEHAIAAGQTCFAESYVQEALQKIATLNHPALEWHFIGPIQSNKTRAIAENFSWVHSIDRLKIAERLSQQRPAHLPPLNVCLQVNVSEEKTKSGIAQAALYDIATALAQLPRLQFRGLMTLPAPAHTLLEQRAPFAQLRASLAALQAKGLPLDTLSMGMTHDFEAAIAEGSTIIRIGTALFGPPS